MALRNRSPGSTEEILADWDTGDYSREHGGNKTQRDLAHKHNVSVAKINKMVKGRLPANATIVNNLIQAKQILAKQNVQSVNRVYEVVDERTKHIQFFNDAAVRNVEESMRLPCENHNDFRARADTIAKGREVVLGKAAETQVNIQNNTTFNKIERVIID